MVHHGSLLWLELDLSDQRVLSDLRIQEEAVIIICPSIGSLGEMGLHHLCDVNGAVINRLSVARRRNSDQGNDQS